MRVSILDADHELGVVGTDPDRLVPSSFAPMYEAHRLSVYRYLRAKTSNDEEALDLTAVTFERAFANHRRFRRRDGGVHAWLLRIAATPPSTPVVAADRRSTSRGPMRIWADAPSRWTALPNRAPKCSISSRGFRTTNATHSFSGTRAD